MQLQRPFVVHPSEHGDLMALIFELAMDGNVGLEEEASAGTTEGAEGSVGVARVATH